MSDLQLLLWGINAVIIFFVTFPILLLILWIVNKWLLKGKIRWHYIFLLSIGIPLLLVAWDYASLQYSIYSSSNMDGRLEEIGVGIKLPPYEVTEYKNEHVIADDFRDTYQMVFKDAAIKSMLPKLDSLCNANEEWTKRGDEYVFITTDISKEFRDSLIVRPYKGTATFVRYMW